VGGFIRMKVLRENKYATLSNF